MSEKFNFHHACDILTAIKDAECIEGLYFDYEQKHLYKYYTYFKLYYNLTTGFISISDDNVNDFICYLEKSADVPNFIRSAQGDFINKVHKLFRAIGIQLEINEK